MIENIQLTAALFGGVAYLSMVGKKYEARFEGKRELWRALFNLSAFVFIVASLVRIWGLSL